MINNTRRRCRDQHHRHRERADLRTSARVTSSHGTNGIIINNASGTFHAHGGDISGASGSDVSLNTGTLNFTDDGTITDSTGTVVSISNMTNGTQSFTGTIGTTGSTDGAISLSSNTGATIDFSGGMALSTGTTNAFSASGGGTVNVTGTNHLTTTTGTALDVANTNIGTSGLTFHDISANGGTNGIVLNNTGTAGTNGGLTVTGDGSTAGSGGTIQGTVQGALFTDTKGLSLSYMNFTNPDSGNGTSINAFDSTFNSAAEAGINLNNVTGATLDHLNVNGNGGSGGVQDGINGISVSNLTISNTTVVGFGDDDGTNNSEGDVRLFNLSGTSNITNSTFGFVPGDASAGDNLVDIRNTTGTLTLNVTGSTFHNTADSTSGADGLQVNSLSNSVVNLNVSHSTFTNLKTAGIDAFARDTSTLNVNITDGGTAGNGNSFTPGTVAYARHRVERRGHRESQFQHQPQHDHLWVWRPRSSRSSASTTSVINGHVDNNSDIANNGTTNRAGSPLDFDIEDNSTAAIEASGNTINNAGQDAGIVAFAAGTAATPTQATQDLTMASNTINLTGTNLNANQFNDGILLVPGANANDTTTIFANVHNNSVTGISGPTAMSPSSSRTPAARLASLSPKLHHQHQHDLERQQQHAGEFHARAQLAGVSGDSRGPQWRPSPILPSNPNALFSASGGVAALNPTQGETNLTQAELNKAVAAAIANWTAAGLSPDKIAQLEHATYDVADITSGWLGQSTPGHVTIDVNADGHGWYIDPTPTDNSEFGVALSSTALLTDSTTAAAGHIDLLTVVEHEMGEQLGLSDQFDPSAAGTLMSAFLANGDARAAEQHGCRPGQRDGGRVIVDR